MRDRKRILFSLCIFLCFVVLFFNSIKISATEDILRLSGEDRYSTAVAISREGWQKTSKYALLATGDDFPDALCAAPLAQKYNAPILLTETQQLNATTLDELKRLNVSNIIIIGGLSAVSSSVEDTIKNNGITVERISGEDRYETSVQIAKKLGSSNKIMLATGNNFADALCVSSIAAKNGIPILLTDKTRIPSNVWQYIEDNGQIEKTYIIGGKDVISDIIMEDVPNAKRLSGSNRYETNVIVMKEFLDVFNFSTVYFAVSDGKSGDEFADALTGSALAAITASPIILVYKSLPAVTDYFLRPKISKSKVIALGGEKVVPDAIIYSILDNNIDKIPVHVSVEDTPETIKVWQTKDVTVLTDPQDASIEAFSSNPNIISASVSGNTVKITGVSNGTATITITSNIQGRPEGSATFIVSSPVYNVTKERYFDKIQDCIDAANSGDTITIAPGSYYEHIDILGDNLKIIGANSDTTIIDASQNNGITRAGIRIKDYSGTEIKNLTVRNAGSRVTGEYNKEPYGIFIWNSNQNVIDNVKLKSNGSYEIYLMDGCNNNIIKNCIIDGAAAERDGYKSLDGIFSCGGEAPEGSRGMISSGNKFLKNIICNVVYGISMTACRDSWIMDNQIHAVDSDFWNGYVSSGIILSNSCMNLVQGNTIDTSQFGIKMSNLSVISPYSYAGPPSSNIVSGNNIHTTLSGIKVIGIQNSIQENIIKGNIDNGIWITNSARSSKINKNILEDNGTGILVENIYNEIHFNKFIRCKLCINNTVDAVLDASKNWWGTERGPEDNLEGNINTCPFAINEECTKFSLEN